MQLHYQRMGEGEPLILIHGLFGSSNNWGNIAKHFSKTHQVISVDLRNHGQSPHHPSQSYQEMADDLLALFNELHLDGAHIIGHSLGGKVAMQFAVQYPARVNHLVVVDMAMRAYADEHTHLIDAMLALDLPSLNTRSAADSVLSSTIKSPMVRQFLLMNIVKIDGQLQWRINLPALKANYPALQQAVGEHALYEKACLFIRGEHSDYVRDTDIAHIKNHFTQAQFTSLPTAHWVHAEQPQVFIEVVSQFLTH